MGDKPYPQVEGGRACAGILDDGQVVLVQDLLGPVQGLGRHTPQAEALHPLLQGFPACLADQILYPKPMLESNPELSNRCFNC